jgi:hypothetical protein
MITEKSNNITDAENVELRGNEDDLQLKVSIQLTNGDEKLIDMQARADFPFALRKGNFVSMTADFRAILNTLVLLPVSAELDRILLERYKKNCEEEKLATAVTPEYDQVNPEFVPTTPDMPKGKRKRPLEPEPWQDVDTDSAPGAMRKAA